jgi:hypothetical protein
MGRYRNATFSAPSDRTPSLIISALSDTCALESANMNLSPLSEFSVGAFFMNGSSKFRDTCARFVLGRFVARSAPFSKPIAEKCVIHLKSNPEAANLVRKLLEVAPEAEKLLEAELYRLNPSRADAEMVQQSYEALRDNRSNMSLKSKTKAFYVFAHHPDKQIFLKLIHDACEPPPGDMHIFGHVCGYLKSFLHDDEVVKAFLAAVDSTPGLRRQFPSQLDPDAILSAGFERSLLNLVFQAILQQPVGICTTILRNGETVLPPDLFAALSVRVAALTNYLRVLEHLWTQHNLISEAALDFLLSKRAAMELPNTALRTVLVMRANEFPQHMLPALLRELKKRLDPPPYLAILAQVLARLDTDNADCLLGS